MLPSSPLARRVALTRRRALRSFLCLAACGITACDHHVDDATADPAAQVVTTQPRGAGVSRTPITTTPTPAAPASAWDVCDTLARRAGIDLPQGDSVSWARLLCEVVDLDRFTRGTPNYTVAMASSRDPRSQVEGNEDWFANNDFNNYLRVEGNESVLLDEHGPGVLTRFWSANPSGTVRIYIDGQKTPAIQIELARLLRGNGPAPLRAPFAYVSGKGSNLIFPIPYASSVKVTVSGAAPKLFYQVDHRRYPEGTTVEPYSAAGAAKLAPLAREVQKVLDNPALLTNIAPLTTHTLQLSDAQPEQVATLGPSVVRSLTLQGFQPTDAWLRTTRLIMKVDGKTAIDAPVSTLFTADLGVGNAPHTSLATSVSAQALTMRWPIPVHETLQVSLSSNGGRIGDVAIALDASAGLPANPLEFHAQWTGARVFNTEKPVDWTPAHLRGAGYYVGTVFNMANPVTEWWGEGDEKIFIDGAATPSIFGTGTEDYFGYAWCANHTFATPWNGQPRYDGVLNWGRASMYRWHVLEAIPFQSELRFNLEVQHWMVGANGVKLTEDALAIWYATPETEAVPHPLALPDFRVPVIETARPAWPLPFDCEFLSLLP